MNKNRIQYIDIARGISMVCIVLGHLGEPQINRVVFTFHLPIFFLISGYFLKEETDIKSLLKQRIRSLLVPYWLTCLAIICLSMVFCEIFTPEISSKKTAMDWVFASLYGSGDTYKEPFYIKQIGALWFLLATFWGTLFLRLILNLGKNGRILAVLLLFCFGIFSPKWFWLPMSLQPGCCAVLFMYFGYLCKRIQASATFTPEVKTWGTVCAFIVWIFFIRDFKSFWLSRCNIGRGVVDIFGCLCACFCLLKISQFIEKHLHRLTHILAYLGKYSVFMLCAHIVELNLFPWWRLLNLLVSMGMPEYLTLYVKIACKFAWILPVMLICSKWTFTRKLFGFDAPSPKQLPKPV